MNEKIFSENGYCLVKDVLPLELRDFITQYALFDEMQDFSSELMQGREQVPNAHSKYGDPAMEVMLMYLHKIMEENTGLTLYPTYSYYRVYRSGDILENHLDRPSCEISATLCFNYSYDNSQYQWPIFINETAMFLNPGDMAIYKGCELPHWRETFNVKEDDWQVQGFFHYVDANGPYAEWKFDKRNIIGEKKVFNKKSYIEYLK